MRKLLLAVAVTAMLGVTLAAIPRANAGTVVPPSLPNSMAAIGDSISQAFDDCCYYGNHPQDSWSTGWLYPWDGVDSHYARILAANKSIAGKVHDDAVAGAKVGGIGPQVQQAISQKAQYVTVLIGANDVCTSSISTMTSAATFKSQFAAEMAALMAGLPPRTPVFVSSIPNIYHLWSVLRSNPIAELVWYGAKICQSMLSPFNTEADRQIVLARVKADNAALASVCRQYSYCKWDKWKTYGYQFAAGQVSGLDYFHPNLRGQAALAAETWLASWWPTVK